MLTSYSAFLQHHNHHTWTLKESILLFKEHYGIEFAVETVGFVWFKDVGGQSRILKDVLKSGAEKCVNTVKGGIQINDYLTYNW